MKTFAMIMGAAIVSQTVSAHFSATDRKERRFALRQLYERQSYPGELSPPSCQTGFDTATTGSCDCGPGRVQNGDLCSTPYAEDQFNEFTLTEPVLIPTPITVTQPFTGPSEFLTANLCASIAASLRTTGATGFYYQGATGGEADCWVIGGPGVYNNPSETGIPFTPATDAATKVKRQDAGQIGFIGQPGGVLGFDGVALPGTGTTGCLADFDVQNIDGTCTCGVGRQLVPGTTNICQFVASALPARRAKRSMPYGGTQW